MRVVMVTGGARSGKSHHAVNLARRIGRDDVTFIATARRTDPDMATKIARHRAERPQSWRTVEAPVDAGIAISAASTDVVILDCLTVLTSNAMLRCGSVASPEVSKAMLKETSGVLDAADRNKGTLIIVTNEVGWAVHPSTDLGRVFRDGLGEANRKVSSAADEVILMVSGLPLILKPATR